MSLNTLPAALARDSIWDDNGYLLPVEGTVNPFAPLEWTGGFYITPGLDFAPVYVIALALATLFVAALFAVQFIAGRTFASAEGGDGVSGSGRRRAAKQGTARKLLSVGLIAALATAAFGGVAASLDLRPDQTEKFGQWAVDRYEGLTLSKKQAVDLLNGEEAFVEQSGVAFVVTLVRGYDQAYYLTTFGSEVVLSMFIPGGDPDAPPPDSVENGGDLLNQGGTFPEQGDAPPAEEGQDVSGDGGTE